MKEDRQTNTCSECLSDTNRLKTIIYTIPSQVNSCMEDRIIYSFALMQQINRPSSKRHLHLCRTSWLFGPKYRFLLRNHWDQRHPMRNPVWCGLALFPSISPLPCQHIHNKNTSFLGLQPVTLTITLPQKPPQEQGKLISCISLALNFPITSDSSSTIQEELVALISTCPPNVRSHLQMYI